MPTFDQYDITIADYLDNNLSPEQEAAFTAELGTNADLRQRYEEELTIRAIMGSNPQEEEAVDAPVPGYPRLAVKKDDAFNEKKTATIPFFRRAYAIAAVLVLVVSGSAIFLILKNQGGKNTTIAETHNKIDTSKHIDTANINPALVPFNSQTAATAFAKLYKPYSSNNDPVEASEFYQDYKQGRYASVLKATNADVQVMGVEDDKNRPIQYLQLYKGLAYLAQDEPAKALTQFGEVLHTAGKQDAHYYAAQWYSYLALLKIGDVQKADSTAKVIAQSKSPYAANAKALPAATRGK